VNISALRPKTQLALGVVLPLACAAFAALLIWPPTSDLRAAGDEIEVTTKMIAEKKVIIRQAEAMASGRPLALAVAGQDEHEPIQFLRQLAALTDASNCELVGVRATRLPPVRDPRGQQGKSGRGQQAGVPAQPTSVGGQRPVLPAKVRELTDEVTVEGRFNAILGLLVRLETFERILSVSRCRVNTADYPRLRTTFTLSRFVAKPEPPGAASTAGATASSQARLDGRP
jgi:hypothetical protein